MAYQDFETYTIAGDDAPGGASASGATLTFTDIERADNIYVYKDFGSGYFTGDFSHQFVLYVDSFERTSNWNGFCLYMLSNNLGTLRQVSNTDTRPVILVELWNNASTTDDITFAYRETQGGALVTTSVNIYEDYLDTDVYITIARSGTTLTMTARHTSHSGDAIATITHNETSLPDFQYLTAFTAMDPLTGTYLTSGTIRNLDIGGSSGAVPIILQQMM
jgi:hypothetical protein